MIRATKIVIVIKISFCRCAVLTVIPTTRHVMRVVANRVWKTVKRSFSTVTVSNVSVSTFPHARCAVLSNISFYWTFAAELDESVLDKVDAVSGFCDGNCQNFIYFIILFSFLVFIHSTSEVGSMLLIMRCTDPKGMHSIPPYRRLYNSQNQSAISDESLLFSFTDKAMAMGIIQFAISLFGNVPCPIIYGAVIDSTCLIWETICDKQGACSLYDPDAFRHFFLGKISVLIGSCHVSLDNKLIKLILTNEQTNHSQAQHLE